MKKKVAYITTVYNVNKYLEQCLSSLEKIETDKEVIIVDDRGNEDPFPIIEKFLSRNSNFKYIKNNKNLGTGFSRSEGVKAASKDVSHIYFIDSDDFLDPAKIDNFVKNSLKIGENFVTSSFYFHFKNKDVHWKSKGWFPEIYLSNGEKRNSCIYVWGSFWVADTVRSTPFLSRSYEDGVWMSDILDKIEFFENFDETMHFYRRRKSSIVNSKKSAFELNEMSAMIERESRFKKFVNFKEHITGQLYVFYEHFFRLNASERKKVHQPSIGIKINVSLIRFAIFFQKLSFFGRWYVSWIERKNFFE